MSILANSFYDHLSQVFDQFFGYVSDEETNVGLGVDNIAISWREEENLTTVELTVSASFHEL